MNRLQLIAYATNSVTELALLFQNHSRMYNGNIPLDLLEAYHSEFLVIYQRLVKFGQQPLSAATVSEAGSLVWALKPGENVLVCVDKVINRMVATYKTAEAQSCVRV
ncbi:hypothetical protein [Chitinophaga arvensicola]|uniref:Uncharacterized protein n=1 Tax=Chitinophaga arvensicola TaxID=29529 RepID=A0A1I0PQS9_9BACT|nr:hypothetical protein [Chitinophaga arvensicola]SEW16702.1 hypothetical protein SAMN04488122_0918 [Chitinophaga arvensicola]